MKTKKKTAATKKKTATGIRIVERVVGLRPDYQTPFDVEDAIRSYAGCYRGYPVHRIIAYARRLESLLRGGPSCPGNYVLYPRCCLHSPCGRHL